MIAIPNMDKPKSCTECPFEVIGISGYPRCVIVQEMVVDGNLFNRCPLIDIVRCGECKKVNTKQCPMYSAGWGYTNDDWCSCGERKADD